MSHHGKPETEGTGVRWPWLITAAVGLAAMASACGGAKIAAKPSGPQGNAPLPSLSPAATATPSILPGSLSVTGPYRFVRPPIAIWTDYPPRSDGRIPALVFVRLNRDLAYGAPLWGMDGHALALNSGGYSDERQGHCYEADLNAGWLPPGYYVGRPVTIDLTIDPTHGQPGGHLSVKVPLRPALAQTPRTSAGPGTVNDLEQYFYVLGCGHTR